MPGVHHQPMATPSAAVLRAVEEGCYGAARASGLSGVPLSTVYHWARTDVVVPSVSPTREMLWSYADLMTLRIVSWLRHPKWPSVGAPIPASPMRRVRAALNSMAERGLDPWAADANVPSPIVVDRTGAIFIRHSDHFIELRDLIGSGFQGCMRIPAGSVGGDEKCSEGGRPGGSSAASFS